MDSKKLKILLAEDDTNLGTILKAYLEAKGYETELYGNGELAFKAYQSKTFDFCILDVMMPLKDGFTLAKEIRKEDKEIPILFLTAKSLQDDVIEGFKIGADDYITKPFSMEELLLRMNAVLRRSQTQSKQDSDYLFVLGKLEFDFNRQELKTQSETLKLTAKESELLKLLCENKNDILERTEALIKIWQDDSYFNARSMDVYVAKLRKYLKADPNLELMNVHGRGFKLIVP